MFILFERLESWHFSLSSHCLQSQLQILIDFFTIHLIPDSYIIVPELHFFPSFRGLIHILSNGRLCFVNAQRLANRGLLTIFGYFVLDLKRLGILGEERTLWLSGLLSLEGEDISSLSLNLWGLFSLFHFERIWKLCWSLVVLNCHLITWVLIALVATHAFLEIHTYFRCLESLQRAGKIGWTICLITVPNSCWFLTLEMTCVPFCLQCPLLFHSFLQFFFFT